MKDKPQLFILKQGKPQLSTRNIPLSSLGILFELYSYVIPALPRLLSQFVSNYIYSSYIY
jgi:hypothetical protein